MLPINNDNTSLPPPERVAAPAPTVSVEAPGRPALDRISDIASAFSNAVHQGLSYSNARRARDTYRS